MFDRRTFLTGAAGAIALLAAPNLAIAQAATDRRFIFIIQRGAADGLNTVIPYAEPAYARLRGPLAIDASTALKLDGTFALHPALPKLRELYAAGEASFLQAVASPSPPGSKWGPSWRASIWPPVRDAIRSAASTRRSKASGPDQLGAISS